MSGASRRMERDRGLHGTRHRTRAVGPMSGTDDRIRVLWLSKGLGPGGMERLLVHHAAVGDSDRFSYSAAYLVDRPNSVVPELEALGVECIPLVGGRDVDPRWTLRLREVVRRRGIDVVHAHSPMPAALARPVLRSMRSAPKLVYTEHNTWDCYGRTTWAANIATYPIDDAQFSVSREARDSMPSRLARRVEPLTHGIDLDAVAVHRGERDAVRGELGVGETDVMVITVAHFRTEKGYEVLLEAAREVLDQNPHALFFSVGHGPLEAEVRSMHAELGLGDRFRFLGFRADAPRLMAGADVFCLSSHQEGLPVSFMEASALGLPTVATAVGGLVDHVVHRESGMLVRPGRPSELASALGEVVADAELRARLGDGALTAAPAFDAAVAVQRQEAVYDDLVRRV